MISTPHDHDEHDDSQGRRSPHALLRNPYAMVAIVFGLVGAGMMISGNMAGLPFLVIALSFVVVAVDGNAEEKKRGHGPSTSR